MPRLAVASELELGPELKPGLVWPMALTGLRLSQAPVVEGPTP